MINVILRMQLWLNDPGNMDKLLAIKNGQQQVVKMMMMKIVTMIVLMAIWGYNFVPGNSSSSSDY